MIMPGMMATPSKLRWELPNFVDHGSDLCCLDHAKLALSGQGDALA